MAFALAALILLPNGTLAQAPPNKPTTYGFYFGGGDVQLNDAAAQAADIGNRAFSIRIGGIGERFGVLYGGGVSFFGFDDHAQFDQTVQDQYGNISGASSSATAVNLFGEVGYRLPLAERFAVELLGGYEQVVASNRSIADCTDCDVEHVDISSGVYLLPELQYLAVEGSKTAFTVTMAYERPVTGDVESVLELRLGIRSLVAKTTGG
jgi:hypothetical protein